MPIVLLAILAAGLLAVAFLLLAYNRLVRLRNRCRRAFAQIEVQLKRRHDLIPNIVETAKGYIKHERGTLEAVANARSTAISTAQTAQTNPDDPQLIRELSNAETTLTGALSRLLANVEAYPELKANQTMANLMEELTTTENRIALARQAYNDDAMFYNVALQTFPVGLIARQFAFAAAEFWGLENPAEKEVPAASFSSNA